MLPYRRGTRWTAATDGVILCRRNRDGGGTIRHMGAGAGWVQTGADR